MLLSSLRVLCNRQTSGDRQVALKSMASTEHETFAAAMWDGQIDRLKNSCNTWHGFSRYSLCFLIIREFLNGPVEPRCLVVGILVVSRTGASHPGVGQRLPYHLPGWLSARVSL